MALLNNTEKNVEGSGPLSHADKSLVHAHTCHGMSLGQVVANSLFCRNIAKAQVVSLVTSSILIFLDGALPLLIVLIPIFRFII